MPFLTGGLGGLSKKLDKKQNTTRLLFKSYYTFFSVFLKDLEKGITNIYDIL